MKLITRNTDYAIRTICFMAKEKKRKIFSVSFLAKKTGVPYSFLRVLLQILVKKKILASLKGKGGGFYLRKDPQRICLYELIYIFQGKFSLNRCLLGKKVCPNIKNCILCKKIKQLEEVVVKELKNIKVASLIG